MKIAIPIDEKSMESSVCQSFGRAPYFLFYNTVTKEEEFLDNSAVASQGGAGIRAAQVVVDNANKALITPRCGENAEKVLTKAEVFVYKSISGTVKENIEAFTSNELSLLHDFHPGFHGHGEK
ncbi:NifB/NifX family molybdenum-iron cluster-binding protein [Sedimentibacter sp. MB31-C6]|uniref:NifB/NifX family molybdenum-iron cluster-binding protein n=1 Tax=Sedimentibacter sp. MB31-C6 TaxID=3109366 RepID=UPI002DDDA604|nr:NifB/NifX family molybdenum-iron cluster-binding protein [Sedimentibacter sp. MB36-C1]WSI03488.1 NifB/NifX family molybdenum-iron cluster-binding protein [Sedimentibacter sp. MB36-C1]